MVFVLTLSSYAENIPFNTIVSIHNVTDFLVDWLHAKC